MGGDVFSAPSTLSIDRSQYTLQILIVQFCLPERKYGLLFQNNDHCFIYYLFIIANSFYFCKELWKGSSPYLTCRVVVV